MNPAKDILNSVRTGVNNSMSSKEPWQIVTITASTVLISVWLYDFVFQSESIAERVKKRFFKWIKFIPSIRKKIDKELKIVFDNLDKDVRERTKNLKYITCLPSNGLTRDEILKLTDENLSFADYNWKEGRVSGAVYYIDPELSQLVTDVYEKTAYTNPLHVDVFPGLCKMEAEVVRMATELFHGGPESCGTMTSGGTESILMACKAYRDYAREVRGINKPEIVIPTTAHTAFDKAAQYLGLYVRTIPIDPYTTQVNLKAMKSAINCNTVMLVGSVPNYPYGTMDDIAAISELGIRYNVPVHVDSCLGGFLTAFMEDAGHPLPLRDFQLPGVTSISADTHKYGFTPKGSSVILYKEPKYRHYQYTVTTDWPGGVYGSPTVGGSRAGGSIATCWATMLNFGRQGYVTATREILYTSKYIEKKLREMKGIFIFGQPITSVVAIGSNDFEIYRLASALIKLGWSLNALQFPSGIHICVTQVHTQHGVADKFLEDVRTSLVAILKEPDVAVEGKMALYGAAQAIPDRSLVGEFTKYFLDNMYYTRPEK